MSEKVLFFGSNFSLPARIADLTRRDFEVILYEFSASNESGRKKISTAFTSKLLSNALTIHDARYVVFTSESLLYIDSLSVLTKLMDELRACKQLAGIHLTFVDIAEPIVASNSRSIRVLQGQTAYGTRLALLREEMIGVFDSVIQVQSFYTPQSDFWSQNFLRVLFDTACLESIDVGDSIGNWEAISADEVATALLSRLGYAGTTRLSNGPFPGGLRSFCKAASQEYAKWVLSLNSLQTNRAPEDEFLVRRVRRECAPKLDDLHTVVRQTQCTVSYLYRMAPENNFGARTIAGLRKELGKSLAQTIPPKVVDCADVIVPVPETGKIYAQGLAAGLGLPYLEAIYKSDHRRSFDIENFDERREFLYSRLSVIPGLLTGKSIILVDEATH